MEKVVIRRWGSESEMVLRRIVLDPSLNEADKICIHAERLGIPVVKGQAIPQANDLWVGIHPEDGWGDSDDEVMLVGGAEAAAVISWLEDVGKVMSAKWAIEFRNGSFLQTLEADYGGPAKTAMKFETKEAAEAFMAMHEWIYFNGGMAKEVSTPD